MKPTVIVTKHGSVFYARSVAKAGSVSGEQGETEGIIKHLLQRDDFNVVYFGQWRGPHYKNLIIVPSNIDGLNDLSTGIEQREQGDVDVEALRVYDPKLIVTVAGYASTMSSIDNPHYALVQAAGVRYVWPTLNVIQQLRLPRVVINNDPRSYPREGEMSKDFGWSYVRPVALLSQRTCDWTRVVWGTTLRCREVYAGAENWCEHIRRSPTDSVPCTVVAHAHIKDGCKFKGRDIAWAKILAPVEDVDELHEMNLRVYGKGWEHFSEYRRDIMHGPINPSEVMDVLAAAKTCPAVAAGNHFYTSKLRTCLAQNCLPLFYGRGEPFTFDPLGKYWTLHSPYRISEPGELLRQVKYWDSHDRLRENWIDVLWEMSKPDWSLFDNCINDVLEGRDTSNDTWWTEYGGYRT